MGMQMLGRLSLLVAIAVLGCRCATTEERPYMACISGRWMTPGAIIPGPRGPIILPAVPDPTPRSGIMLGTLPTITDRETAAEIIVVRPRSFLGGASRWNITVDGIETYGMCVDEYIRVAVMPGQHTVGVRWWGGSWPGWHEQSLTVTVEERGEYYFLVQPSLAGASIEPLDSEAGRQEIAGRQRLF